MALVFKAGNWYTEEEFTASSQENTDSGDDDETHNENSVDSTRDGWLNRENNSAMKQQVSYGSSVLWPFS